MRQVVSSINFLSIHFIRLCVVVWVWSVRWRFCGAPLCALVVWLGLRVVLFVACRRRRLCSRLGGLPAVPLWRLRCAPGGGGLVGLCAGGPLMCSARCARVRCPSCPPGRGGLHRLDLDCWYAPCGCGASVLALVLDSGAQRPWLWCDWCGSCTSAPGRRRWQRERQQATQVSLF